jgi:uncharacterized protein
MTADLGPIEDDLRDLVRREEAEADHVVRASDSLWDHLVRTARIAEQLGLGEGLDPATCRIGALFHDAGKFRAGTRHGDDLPEEVHSVAVLRDLAHTHGLADGQVEEAAEAILQLYGDEPEPTPLARVLFDADNLDKLGHLGVANFFVKRGLRGGGLSPDFLPHLTVELTYARHAVACMLTATGRGWARRRAPQTRAFLLALIEQLREDGLADLVVTELEHDGLTIDAVAPRACACGRPLAHEISQTDGVTCRKIHLVHVCHECGERHEVRFCRPRLAR